jgi:hypothetical protein
MTEGARSVQVLHVIRPGCAEWVEVPVGPLAPGSMRLDTLYSGVSAGTELTFLKGTNPALGLAWDADLALFRSASAYQPYPVRKLGYMQVARVVATRTPHVAAGDIVAATFGHASGHDLNPQLERFVVLPRELDPLLGIYVAHMGPICANGVLHADADLAGSRVSRLGEGLNGRKVLVTGAGVVGLLTALFAQQVGAEVIVADPTDTRLRPAAALSLEVVDSAAHDVGMWVKQRWRQAPGDCGADVVFQCRGQASSLHAALRALRPQGTVVDLAFYPRGADEVRLGEEFHHNGLRILCAQIGRVPRGLSSSWDRRRLSAETLELLRACGTRVRQHLITDLVNASEAPTLFADLLARRRQTLQAVLKWPHG